MNRSDHLRVLNSAERAGLEADSSWRRAPQVGDRPAAGVVAILIVVVSDDVPSQSIVEGEVWLDAPTVLEEEADGCLYLIEVVLTEGLILLGGEIKGPGGADGGDSAHERGIQ